MKFLGTQALEAYISDVGCLVLKQDSAEFGRELMIIITPDQLYHIKKLIDENLLSMYEDWNDGVENDFNS